MSALPPKAGIDPAPHSAVDDLSELQITEIYPPVHRFFLTMQAQQCRQLLSDPRVPFAEPLKLSVCLGHSFGNKNSIFFRQLRHDLSTTPSHSPLHQVAKRCLCP